MTDIEIVVQEESNDAIGDPKRKSRQRNPTTGHRNVRSRKRVRSIDKRRKSLVRLTDFELTKEEQETELPPVPYSQRKMTDCMFLVLYLAFGVGMLAVGSIGFSTGNPASLVYGRDAEGRICGDANLNFQVTNRFAGFDVNNDMRDFELLTFPRIEKDQQLRVAGVDLDLDLIDFDFFGVCVQSCPKEGDLVCTAEAEAIIRDYLLTEEGQVDPRSRDEIVGACVFNDDVRLNGAIVEECINPALGQQCFETFFDHTEFLFRCFPEYIYEAELIGDETGCLEERTVSLIGGQEVQDCFKFQQVSKVTRIEPPDTNVVFSTFNTVSRTLDSLLGDIINARRVIIGCGIGVAFGTALFYILALKYLVGFVIWGTILFGLSICVAITVILYFKAGILTADDFNSLTNDVTDFANGVSSFVPFGDDGEDEFSNFTAEDKVIDEQVDLPGFVTESRDFAFEFEIAAYISTVVTLIVLLIILFAVSRVNKAIEFFKEASRCIRAKPQLLLTPFISSAVGALVITLYITTALFVATAGSLENATQTNEILVALEVNNTEEFLDTRVFGPLDNQALMNLYLFFGFLWTLQFVSAINLMSISGVVSKWYWAGSPSTRRANILEGDISISLTGTFLTVIRFHLGTAAFGALLIALVQLVRYIAAFIQTRMNKLGSSNRCVKVLACALNCCLKCAENCVKFISHNAYYMTMLYGTPFCTSTKMAFSAFARNLIQVATVTFLGDLILRFGQLFIVTASVLLGFLILDGSSEFQLGGDKELSSIIFPVFIIGALSWFMSKQVLSVYNVAIDTILLSYCQDKKLIAVRNKRGRVKAHKEMVRFVDDNKPAEEDFMRQASLAVYV